MTAHLEYALTLARTLHAGLRQRLHPDDQPADQANDAGLSTLEMAIIGLGLMAIAGLLVAALTGAVTRRTNQIK